MPSSRTGPQRATTSTSFVTVHGLLLALVLAVLSAGPALAQPGGGEDPPPELEDLNAPRIEVTPERAPVWEGWYGDSVSVHVRAFDDVGRYNEGLDAVGYRLSGATTGGGVVDVAAGSAVLVTGAGVTTLEVEAWDRAGNVGRTTHTVRIDRGRPAITFGGRLAETTRIFAPGEPVEVDFGCQDVGGTEVATCLGSVADGATLPTEHVGDHTVTVTATDRVGNVATATRSYTVQRFFTSTGQFRIAGSPAVGQTLRLDVSDVVPQPTSMQYRWIRDGSEVVGESATYQVTAADRGSSLALAFTWARDRMDTLSVTTPAVVVPADPIVVSQEPVLQGEPVVGSGLWVWQPRPTINPSTARVDFAWFRDGERIDTSNSGSPQYFGLTSADQGRRMSLVVTVSAPGHTTRTWELGPTEPVRGRSLDVQGSATVGGPARVGAVLTARPPLIREHPVSRAPGDPALLSYQWLRDDRPIPRATAARYRATAADAGGRLSVRITGTATGHEPAVVTSAPTARVGRAVPALRAAVRALGGGRARLTVRATAPGVPVTGKVVVRRGSKVVLRRSLTAGALTAVLTRQPRGRVTYTVAYGGSGGVAARTVRVTTRLR